MAFNAANCTTAFGYQDGYQTTLSNSMTDSQTTCELTVLPSPTEGTLVIEPGTDNEEEIYYTSKGSGLVNIPSVSAGRGVNGTAKAHNAGVAVKMLITKASLDALKYGAGLLDAGIAKTKLATTLQLELNDGWIPAAETWAYASATTITVPAGAESKYSVGDKIKLTANSVVLYAYIVTVADQLLTVAGNTLTNHTFTANFYSKSTSPVGFPLYTHTWNFPIWIAPSFINSWANSGATYGADAGYMKDSLGFVHLRGNINTGTVATTAFTLPAGYRPAGISEFAVNSGGNIHSVIAISTNGAVNPQVGNNAKFSLDGINFRAEN